MYATSGLGNHQQSDAAQLGEALKTVQAKIGSSLTAPQRPLLDFGIGMSYELDTNDFALLVRHSIACPLSALVSFLLGKLQHNGTLSPHMSATSSMTPMPVLWCDACPLQPLKHATCPPPAHS